MYDWFVIANNHHIDLLSYFEPEKQYTLNISKFLHCRETHIYAKIDIRLLISIGEESMISGYELGS